MTVQLCLVEVAEHYVDAGGARRARWRRLHEAELSVEQARDAVHSLRRTYGAARVTCAAFEVVALRNSFALKLIEPTEPPGPGRSNEGPETEAGGISGHPTCEHCNGPHEGARCPVTYPGQV